MISWNTYWKSQLFAARHLFLATLPSYSWETSFWFSLRHFWTTSPRGSSPSYLSCNIFSELPVLATNLISKIVLCAVAPPIVRMAQALHHKLCTTSFAISARIGAPNRRIKAHTRNTPSSRVVEFVKSYLNWQINIDPENHKFLMETSLPTPICQGLC